MPKKRRTVGGKPAHTSATRQRATNRNRAKRQQRPMMEDIDRVVLPCLN